ncbi:MAG: lysophospholipid acyltransferase family protein [Chloroflexota bacterium]
MKTYYLMRIAALLARLVPPRIAYWLCSLVGGIVFWLSPNIREAVMDNFSHVLPKATLRARRKLARQTVRNVAKNYYDVLRLPGMAKRDLDRTITIYGMEHIDDALAKGKGVILTGGHIGNFSIVAQMAAARGYTMSIIAEDIEPQKLYNFINSLRARFGLRMIKLGSAEVRTIYRLLRNNEGLMLAADRDVNDDGVPTIFFDALAAMPPGPVALALRMGTPFLPVYTYRKPDNTSVAYVSPPMEFVRTGDRDLDLKVNMRKIAEVLEEQITKNPSQWVVLQKIWDKQYTVKETTIASESPDIPSLELIPTPELTGVGRKA